MKIASLSRSLKLCGLFNSQPQALKCNSGLNDGRYRAYEAKNNSEKEDDDSCPKRIQLQGIPVIDKRFAKISGLRSKNVAKLGQALMPLTILSEIHKIC